LGSFGHFEGNRSPLSERLALAEDWIALAHSVGTDLIQVPSNVDSNVDSTASGDIEIIVRELRELADLGMGASPPVSFAYEALTWETYVADWEESWRVVKLVNRDNFGQCLDTYHVCHDYGPTYDLKVVSDLGAWQPSNASIKKFLDECPVDKIFYIQPSYAEKCRPPLLPGHPVYSVIEDPTYSWCFWGRLFPGEEAEGDICLWQSYARRG
jgi:hypothetical protein